MNVINHHAISILKPPKRENVTIENLFQARLGTLGSPKRLLLQLLHDPVDAFLTVKSRYCMRQQEIKQKLQRSFSFPIQYRMGKLFFRFVVVENLTIFFVNQDSK